MNSLSFIRKFDRPESILSKSDTSFNVIRKSKTEGRIKWTGKINWDQWHDAESGLSSIMRDWNDPQ